MNERNALQRIVADLKHGLLEIESHTSMLKKRIFDLERKLVESVIDKKQGDEPTSARMACTSFAGENRMRPFSFLDQIG